MRIGIDARFYGVGSKGLGRYTQKLIENLESIVAENSHHEYFVFLRKEVFDEYVPKNKKFYKVLADYRWYSFSEQINMPRILNKYNLDLVHFPHFNVPIFYNKPFVLTIHDLILLHFPTIKNSKLSPIFYWIKFIAYKLTIGSAIKRAKKIIAVSEFTKEDLIKNYKNAKNKVLVTYEGCDYFEDVNKIQKKDVDIKKYGIIRPYILYVGNAYPHKNLENLILAFKDRSDKKVSLVLVGRLDYFYRKLESFVRVNNIENVVFTDFVADEDLDNIYKNAKAYIFPSLYEGFGLPPLEAMKRNVPVASSDHGCMLEILGEAAIYFDGKNLKEIKNTINKIVESRGLRERLIAGGRFQASKYSWESMAKKTLKIYKNINLNG
jgi:glycosyltransferase involved in cell wall biosynthesis